MKKISSYRVFWFHKLCTLIFVSLQILNVFKHDADYEENEQKYGAIKTELLGDDSGKNSSLHSWDLNLI